MTLPNERRRITILSLIYTLMDTVKRRFLVVGGGSAHKSFVR